MQSCHLCDSCIYDEEIINKMEEKKYCNECEHLKKLQVRATSTVYNNLYCTNTDNGVQKLIDISIPETRKVERPKWCKLCGGSCSNNSQTKHKEMKNWHTINNRFGLVHFEDIKEGDIYHIPPHANHEKREDIIITYKGEFSASYKVITDSKMSYTVNTLWPNTLLIKMLRKHRIMNIQLKN